MLLLQSVFGLVFCFKFYSTQVNGKYMQVDNNKEDDDDEEDEIRYITPQAPYTPVQS